MSNLIKEASKRFGGEFGEKLFLEQLVYFKDLEILPIDFLKESFSPSEIQSFLEKIVDEYTRAKLKQ